MDLAELELLLSFKFKHQNFLITFNPVTLDNTELIITMPNADTEGRVLIKMIEEFVSRHPGLAVVHTSLGQQKYYSCMSHAGAVIGTSSSGLTEAPSFRKATINIGDRQHGRLQAKSVVNCAPQKSEILNAFEEIFTSSF